jgi:hypothetical protein
MRRKAPLLQQSMAPHRASGADLSPVRSNAIRVPSADRTLGDAWLDDMAAPPVIRLTWAPVRRTGRSVFIGLRVASGAAEHGHHPMPEVVGVDVRRETNEHHLAVLPGQVHDALEATDAPSQPQNGRSWAAGWQDYVRAIGSQPQVQS